MPLVNNRQDCEAVRLLDGSHGPAKLGLGAAEHYGYCGREFP
jgi:hypothetical protein